VGASIRLATIGDIADFPSEGTRAAYVGIVPRVHHAHATERRGPVTTRGVTRGPGKAILALARTFLGSISKTLKHNGTVADFPRFVLVNG
jgi:transposase